MVNSEIITLQFGNYSNYIGAHWWNIQESSFVYDADTPPEINYDVLYREGENNKKQVTYTPRLLLTDVKGAFGGYPVHNDLYEDTAISEAAKDFVLWDQNRIVVEREKEHEKNEFLGDLEKENSSMNVEEDDSVKKYIRKYELDDKVRFWSDYVGVKFHPRSITVINKYLYSDHENSFYTFPQGVELWNSELFAEDWADKCRAYAEECDYLQGFHMLYDSNDGFSGLSSSVLTYLQDEFSSKSMLVFPSIPASYSERDIEQCSVRLINSVLSLAELPELSSAFVPLCTDINGWEDSFSPRTFNNILYDNNLLYHNSAILASFLDIISMSYRSRQNSIQLSSCLERLNTCGRKLLTGTISLPFPVYAGLSMIECFERLEDPYWTSLTPKTNVTLESSSLQEFNIRGLSSFRLLPNSNKRPHNPTYTCKSIKELFSMYLNFCRSTSSVNNSVINSFDMPLKIPVSFPNIFAKNVTRIGCIAEDVSPLEIAVIEAPSLAGLHNCTSASVLLTYLERKASNIKLNDIHQFSKTGFEKLEYLEAIEKLSSLRDNYL